MPIEFNLWSLLRDRWLALASMNLRASADASNRHGARPDGQPPPMSCDRLSAHLRRDIGLDIDRV